MSDRKQKRPPAFPRWLASKLINDNYLEEFFGDLQEIYEDRVEAKGRFHAGFMYWVDSIHLLIGFSSSRIFKTSHTMMLSNMFKIAWRNAIRQKQFTFLNVMGLTIGIATCFIIGLFVHNELSFDTFHTKGDRIYRVNQPMIWGNWEEQFSSTGPNVAIALQEDAPEFEAVTRLMNVGEQTVNASGNNKEFNLITEAHYYAADPNFFEVFSFEFLQGNPATALLSPYTMVITEETAKRYFGTQDPFAKTIAVKQNDNTWQDYSITGVLANIPPQSHIQFDMLVSMSSFKKALDEGDWKWIWTSFSTYGLVKEGTDVQALSHSIQSIPPKWAATTTERIFNQTFEEYTKGKAWTLYLQPLRSIYSSGSPDFHRFGPTGNPQIIKIFGAIGLLVLVLCSINFMNLSTARSSNRAKEVGIRKVMGSERGTLMKQFVFESVLFVMVGTVCGMMLAQLLLPGFNVIAVKQLSLVPYLSNPIFISGILLFVLMLGTLSGSYPAWYLSAFKPIETLKGKASASFKGKGIRNGLVVFQFTISITLIICTFFVQRQLSYTSSLDLGFAKESILQIHNIEHMGFDSEVLKTQLVSNPAITTIGKSFGLPPNFWDGERFRPNGPSSDPVYVANIRADEDYLDLLELQFVAGHNFDKASKADKLGVILNESAVKALGWGTPDTYATDSPIGKTVIQAFDKEATLEVLGVVKDFNFHSTKLQIEPLMIIHPDNNLFWYYGFGASYLSMRLNPEAVKNTDDLKRVLGEVKTAIANIEESVPFKYSFMDEEFEKTFATESRMSTILNIFTGMALIIACLGLFGLAAFSAEQRTKELGIRKVLGAKVSQLVLLFSAEFTKLIVISILIASPIAYFLVDNWLQEFAYRTPIDLWVFVIATATALTIALVTISYQSLTAAYKNPTETLKEE
ncbi:MAG: ABC transporter permease [Cyclobacteriaceae bacterium]